MRIYIMSESSAFANYTNTVQRLADSVTQEQPRTEQITDDAKNFEQQFIIGGSLHAKIKASEKLVGLLKKSKTVRDKVGQTKDEIERLAKKGFDSAREQVKATVRNIQNRVVPKPADSTPPPPPPQPPAADDLKPLEDAKRAAENQRDITNAAKEAANEEVENSTADLAAARTSERVAKQVAEDALQKSISSEAGRISTDTVNARKAALAAEKNRIAADARVNNALQEQSRLEQLAVQHTSTAERAGEDLRRAQQSQSAARQLKDADAARRAGPVAADAEDEAAAAAKETQEAARLARLTKAESVAEDIEGASIVSDEADPIGFLVTAAAAAATQIIGRKIKAHEMITEGIKIPLSYTSTIGA